MTRKEYLKMTVRMLKQAEKHMPVKAYTRDAIARNLYNCFVKRYPDGSPSETLTNYAVGKVRGLPVYPVR